MNTEVQEVRRVARKSPLSDRLAAVRDRIAEAAIKARRDPREITLIAVTKTAAPEQIREVLQLGVLDLGESRVQQLTQRASQLQELASRRSQYGEAPPPPERARWHMIGHLQRNKVKALLPLVSMIHSVDSLRLAEELDCQCGRLGRRLPVLMQVNASEEPQKSGVAVGAAVHLAEQIDSMPNLQLMGLMTMAELTDDTTRIQRTFARTREIFEEMRWHKLGGAALKHLSMGMSNDFELAIAEGATMVRIGSLLFGGRPEAERQGDKDE
ncbi:MAG: YggS family pyridoxal phosphate-dependent enzyme [Phycisphaerae bacterium]|nr:YggS family pyridoxal phosphate-dependent enzyme [Phycisphaerae bacterium]MDW8261769.1 YggS family pyridoxal phosphate-dependent enzyme [Phycisphaerales bacterium]